MLRCGMCVLWRLICYIEMVSRCVAMVDRMLRRATRKRLENFWNGQSSDTVNRQGSSVHKKYR